MTVENANAFLADVKANGPSAAAMQKIGKDFTPEHMREALKTKGVNHDDLLKSSSGGSKASDWTSAGGAAAGGAAAGAAAAA